MKILLISDKPPCPGSSGGALAIKACLNGMVYHGEDLTLIAAETKKHSYCTHDPADEVMKRIKYESVFINTGINIFSLLINLLFSTIPYNIQRFKSCRYRKKLKEILISEEFDIVQIEGMNMTVYIPVIRKYSKALISVRTHNIESEIWDKLAVGEKKRLKKLFLRSLSVRMSNYEIKTINNCDLLIPITENDASFFLRSGVDIPLYTYPFGIDMQKDDRINQQHDASLVYIGSLDWRPNQEGLVWFINTVWPKVLEYRTDIKLRIAGRNAPKWLINKLNVKGIDFVGEVENAAAFISTGSIMIVPLLSGSGIRVRIVQAMALGIPLISTSKGIEGINAHPGEDLLIAKNSEEYCDHIIELINNNKLQDKLIKTSTAFISSNFDNNELSKGLLNFYSKQVK